MTLVQRLTRFIKADLHGLLDSLEAPEDIVQQTIRDMEEALGQKAHHLSTLRTRLQRLQAEQHDLARVAQEIDHNIDLCFEAGNETLVRTLLRQRLDTRQQAQQLSCTLEDVQTQSATCERTIAEQRDQLAAVVAHYQRYSATRPEPASAPPAMAPWGRHSSVTEETVELAFLEEKRRRATQPQAEGA